MKLQDILAKYFKEEALTEDVQTEITALFDAAVNDKVEALKEEKEAELEKTVRADLTEFKKSLVDNLNGYLAMIVEEFIRDNEVAMTSEIKVAMAEAAMGKLMAAFKENFIEIKEEELDAMKDLETKNADLAAKLDETTNQLVTKTGENFEYQKAIAFSKITEGMSDNQRTKLLTLVEDIEVNNIDSFVKKVTIIKDSFIKEEKEVGEEVVENVNEETDVDNPDQVINEDVDEQPSPLAKYLPGNRNVL